MLPAVTLTFVLGLSLGSYLPYFPVTLCVTLAAATGLAALLEVRRLVPSRQSILFLGALFAGCVYWTVFDWATDHASIVDHASGLPATIEGSVTHAVRHAPGRLTALVHVTSSDDPTIVPPFELRLTWRNPDRDLAQNMTIRTRTHVRPPSGTINPRGFDYGSYLDGQGIDAVASVSGPAAVQVLDAGSTGLFGAVHGRLERWRAVVRRASDSLDQPARSLFLSLTIGEQGYLVPEIREWFMTTGTVHILSISGSHLGLIALLTYGLIKGLCLRLPPDALLALSRRIVPTRLAALLTMVPILGYTLLAGAETATVRSCIMIAIGLMTVWYGYPRYILHALAAAACLTLLGNPRALYDISFQLSYGSVLVLALTMNPQSDSDAWSLQAGSASGRLLLWLKQTALVTFFVTLATLPLVAFYFNQVPWLGLFANTLVIPYVGLILLPLCLLSAGWVIATDDAILPAAEAIQLLSDGMLSGLRWLANLPVAEWFVAAPTVPMMILFYTLGWGLLRSRMTDEHRAVRPAMAAGMAVILAWWLWSPRPFPAEGHARATFLDVGQGDGAVLELPSGVVMLIDGGATYERFDMGRGVVAPFLWNRGIRHIDAVIGTHPQLDHMGGLAWVLAHFQVHAFWTNGATRQEEFWRNLNEVLVRRHLSPSIATAGLEIPAGERCRMAILNPRVAPQPDLTREGTSLNNRSIVTRLTCGRTSMLFTGDIEREGLAGLMETDRPPHVAVLKVPHHGARSSFTPSWLAATQPDIAVFSAGRHNPYGHPAAEVVAAYRQAGAQVLRTDRQGAVWVDIDLVHDSVEVRTMQDWALQPVVVSKDTWHTERENYRRLWHRWNWI